jgi:hypothetical protein
MGRKLVRENELLQSGGLLSFPRTGCALCAVMILSRGQKSRHCCFTRPTPQRAQVSRLFFEREPGLENSRTVGQPEVKWREGGLPRLLPACP